MPDVLERIGGEAAAEVLADNLLDGDAALRLRILVALGGARDARPDLPIDPRLLEAALGAEVLGHYRSYQVLGTIQTPGPGPGADRARPARRDARGARADLPAARPAPPAPRLPRGVGRRCSRATP